MSYDFELDYRLVVALVLGIIVGFAIGVDINGCDINAEAAEELFLDAVNGELPYIDGNTTLDTVYRLYDAYKPLSTTLLGNYLGRVCD